MFCRPLKATDVLDDRQTPGYDSGLSSRREDVALAEA